MNPLSSLVKRAFLGSICSSVLFFAGDISAAPTEVIGMWDQPIHLEETTLAGTPAPKGGTLRLGAVGNFDSFNPFAPRGVSASSLGLTYEMLGEPEKTEEYMIRGLIAESFDLSDDRLSMIVKLRPEARFTDGVGITSKDVVWTFNALLKEANPVYRNNYRDIAGAEALDPYSVKFTFKNGKNRELPLIAATLPVLPSHWWQGKNLGDPQKTPMPSSGPYRLESWNMGSSLRFVRVKDWWAQKLAQNVGRYNFDTVIVDYYRDPTVMREAFFAGNIDFHAENTIKDWNLAYNIRPVQEGKILRADVPFPGVFGMYGVFMNMRRPDLADIRVRRALSMIFNFERLNKTMFFNSFGRPKSFWTGSEEMAAKDPMSKAERAILEKLPAITPADYEHLPTLQSHRSTGESRQAMRRALKLFAQAGWTLKDGRLVNHEGRQLQLDLIMGSPALVRNFTAYAADLERVGVKLNLLPLDQTQFFNRIRHFDYDLLLSLIRQSSNPGNEQQSIWSSKAADQIGSRNHSGIKEPAVDALLDAIAQPASRTDLVNNVRVLDRILQTNCYVIPGWYSQTWHIAWWKDRIEPPSKTAPDAHRNSIYFWHRPEGKVQD